MKKLTICSLVFLIILIFSGCKKPVENFEKDSPNTDALSDIAEKTEDETQPRINEVVPNEFFLLSYTCDDNSVDLSGIETIIYTMTPSPDSYGSFIDEFAFIITTENGSAEFKRPSECFSIKVDRKTLPEGYGVKLHNQVILSGTNSYNLILSKDYYKAPSEEEIQRELVLKSSQLHSQYETYRTLCKSFFEAYKG